MAYNSLFYLAVFLTLTYVAWALVPARKKPFVLLLASAVFIWSASGLYILWIVATAVVCWLCGLALGQLQTIQNQAKPFMKEDRTARKELTGKISVLKKGVVALSCTLILGCLLWLKYLPFTLRCANAVLALAKVPLGWAVPSYVLPLGLSFYSLMAVSYLVDVYRGTVQPAAHFWQLALYLGFWPHVVEGPFDRYEALAPTLCSAEQKPNYQNLSFGVQRMLLGMLKKLVVADRANMMVVAVFDNAVAYSGKAILLATLLYTLQIYAEFSGCMDLVLGSAQLFGIPLAENFRQPFFSRSVGEFWRRWHITLGSWLREYLFQPLIVSKPFVKLGKKTREKLGSALGRLVPVWIGLFLTWMAIGAWHGAGFKYLLYGLYYCGLQLLGQWFEPLLQKVLPHLNQWRETAWYRAWQIARTFVLVNIGMLIFRANGAGAALKMLKSIGTPYGESLLIKIDARDAVVLAVGAAVMLVIDILHERGLQLRRELARRPLAVRWAVYVVGMLIGMVFGAYGDHYDPVGFIYAQF